MNRLYDNSLLTDLISRLCLLIDDFIVGDFCCLITDDGTVKEYHSIEDMGFYTTGVVETDNGGWEDNGKRYEEYTLVIYLSDTTLEDVHAAANDMISVFNQSSVLIQQNKTKTEFYAGDNK